MKFLRMHQWTQPQKILVIILCLSFVVHVASDVAIFTLKPESISTTPDPLDYRLAALNLLDYHTFSFASPEYNAPQLLRTPLYPALLAFTYLFDHRTGLLMILLQSVMLVGMGVLLFILLRHFHVSDRISLVLTGLYMFEPLQWHYTFLTMTETLSSLIVLLLITGALIKGGVSKLPKAALYGFFIGLLILIKPSATMWVPSFLLLVLCAEGTIKTHALRIFITLAFLLTTLSPWIMRNYNATGHFILSSSSAFNFILFAGTPETTPSSYYDVVTTASYNGHSNNVWYAYTTTAYPMLVAAQKEILSDVSISSLVTRQIEYAPSVWFGFTNPKNQEAYGHEYSLFTDMVIGHHAALDRVIDRVDTFVWSVLLILTVAGSIVLLVRRSSRLPYIALLVVLLLTVFINFTASWTRMLLPVYPVIFVATGVGLEWFVARVAFSMRYKNI